MSLVFYHHLGKTAEELGVEQNKSGERIKLIAALGIIGLFVAGFAVYWFTFRDTAPASVDTVAAAEARQEAIDEAVAQPDTTASDSGTDELDVGQPDSAASIGSAIEGSWTVDSSIGSFDASCLEAACSSSFAGFRINEELASIGAKTVVGRTPDVTGTMEIQGTQVLSANFTVDMTTLITDNDGRTSAIKGTAGGLETSTFPQATFNLTAPIELGAVPAEGTSVQVQAVGELMVHGVTRSVTIPLTAELQAGLIVMFGELPNMLLSDYNIPKPSAIAVVSVEETAIMELQLFLRRS